MRRLLPDLPRNAWIVLGGDALTAVGSGLTLPFFVVYLHRVRGIELGIAGLALATIAVGSLAGNAIGGALTDRIGSRRAATIGLAVAAAGTAWLAFVSQSWEAFGAATTIGVGRGVVWPSLDSLLAVTVRPGQRSSVFAVRHATLNAGFGIGGLIAAAIVSFESTRTFQLLYVLDAVSYVSFVPLLLALKGVGTRPDPAESAGANEGPRGYREVLSDLVFLRVVVLTVLLFGLGYAQFNAAFPAFATSEGGISAGALGLAFAVNTLAVALLQLPVLRLAQGHRRTACIALVFSLWAATWGVTLTAGELGSGAAAVALFAAAAAVFALGETLMSPALAPLVNDVAPDRLRGRYNGLYTLALTTGFMLGPVVAGAVLGAGHATALFLALIGGCGVSALVALRLRRHLPVGVDLVGGFRAQAPDPAAAPGALVRE